MPFVYITPDFSVDSTHVSGLRVATRENECALEVFLQGRPATVRTGTYDAMTTLRDEIDRKLNGRSLGEAIAAAGEPEEIVLPEGFPRPPSAFDEMISE